ncbi:MAG: vitamin K epoxide reductase family protein [bacterium]|nr:vitamin K epoxide reductase family protein [bacterium]
MKNIILNVASPIIKPGPFISPWLARAFFILSLIGLGDATYLTAKHYLGGPITCSLFQGCEKVLTSQYSVMWGVPVALLGVIYYLAILALITGFIFTERATLFRIAAKLTPLGLAASLWFLYLQAFVIHAFCLYCLISTTLSTLLFILEMYSLVITKNKNLYGQ